MNSELKPKIRFKGFTDDWEQRKLGEIIIDTIDNRGKNPPYYCESGIPIIDNFMIKNNGYPNLKIATRYLDDYLFNNFVRKYNELDDTLITLVGNGIGNIALFPKEKSAIIQNTLGMRFEEPKKFKYYSLLSKNNQIIKLDRGMAQPSIRQDELKDIDIELPIFDEQLKISRLMSNLDNLITLHQRKCDKLLELKKSLLEKMFPQNNSIIPEIRFKGFTDDWEQRKLGEIFKYSRPDNHLVSNTEYLDYGKTPVLTANKAFVLGYTNESKTFDNNSIIFDDFTLESKYVDFPYMVKSSAIKILEVRDNIKDDLYFNYNLLNSTKIEILGHARHYISIVQPTIVRTTFIDEQKSIATLFASIDNLITLHQRYKNRRKGVDKMDTYDGNELFYKYYERWINVYKEGAIRKSTMQKYNLSLKWLKKLAPKLKLKEVNRITYQEILNGYAEKHERQSTMDFHHQIKASVLDAVDDGYIEKDPTRKAIIKGRTPVREKKEKYLNQFELQKLISDLDLKNSINSDWLIYLIAKTGLRFSEALAITPKDFDFPHQILNVDKTWNYKDNTGFEATKNKSSERKVQLDWQTVIQFSELVKDLEPSSPIFINDRIYNSTINDLLARHCKRVEIPVISIHGLRHTHASLLLYAGVSVASVAHRLGHASMTTTQKIYLHIIQELENTDIDKIMRALTSLNS